MDKRLNGHIAEVEETTKIIVNLVEQFKDNSLNGHKAEAEETNKIIVKLV